MKNVQIQTSGICNASCLFCPYSNSWYKKNPGTMSNSLFEKILNDLTPFKDELYTGKFCPYLMNDPFTDPKIIDRVKKIYEYFPNIKIEISTNAELMTPNKIDELLDILNNKRHDIWISFHGASENDISKIMKINGKKSLTNIIYLLKESDGRFNIKIRGLLYSFDSKIKLQHPKKFLRFWNSIISKEDINSKNLKLEPSYFHNRSANSKLEDWSYNAIVRRIGPKNPFYCGRIDNWIHIDYTGDILLCCNDYHKETVMNNINDMSIIEHLQSKPFKEMRNKVLGKVLTEENFLCNRCTRNGG